MGGIFNHRGIISNISDISAESDATRQEYSQVFVSDKETMAMLEAGPRQVRFVRLLTVPAINAPLFRQNSFF